MPERRAHLGRVFYTGEMRARGASWREVRRQRSASTKVRHGAYASDVTDEWHLFDLRCEATLRSVGGSALAGPAAARFWGLPLVGSAPDVVHVRGVRRGGGYSKAIKVVSGADPDVVDHNGVRVTTVAWTVADCARLLPRRDALIVADAALHRGLCSIADLRHVLHQLGRAKGVARLRWIIANADPASESAGETWMRMVVTDLGYSVVSQFPVQAEGHKHRIDLLLQGTHVGLEFDGLIKYGSDLEDPDPEQIARVVRDEKRRHARIEGRGYRLLRIIWEQLSDPTTLDRRIRHALGQGAARRSVPPTPPW